MELNTIEQRYAITVFVSDFKTVQQVKKKRTEVKPCPGLRFFRGTNNFDDHKTVQDKLPFGQPCTARTEKTCGSDRSHQI